MRKVLIISPHFPPVNAPDMHRVRMSLPYYSNFGWDAEVIYVDTKYVEGFQDDLLVETIPENIKLHSVRAFPTWLTRKFGLGSLSIRSFIFYFFKVNSLLKRNKYDLILFSTTMFHVGALGPYWKWRFNVPFIVDLQDPWRNDYYLNKPKPERPPKFWFSYLLLKFTEQIAIPKCSGIISVSEGYISEIKYRYPSTVDLPMKMIPFGSSLIDFDLVSQKLVPAYNLKTPKENKINIVYIGAITPAFIPVIRAFFECLINKNFEFINYHFYFLGTSYSLTNSPKLVEELASQLGIKSHVSEQPQRLPYFMTLATLKSADILFIPGSLDVDYNASKIYNSILSGTPIFSIFNNKSEVKNIIEKSNSGIVIGFDNEQDLRISLEKDALIIRTLKKESSSRIIPEEILAEFRTKQQCSFFNNCLER